MEQIIEEKIRENIMEANDHWNDWRFQLYWNKLEWADPKKINSKNNPFYSSTHKFYIKYG